MSCQYFCNQYHIKMDPRNTSMDSDTKEEGSFLGMEGVTPANTGARGNRRGNRRG